MTFSTPGAATDAFENALRKGTGRAMIMLRSEPGSMAMRAVLLQACKVNLAYDRQCEEPRCDYLYRLILASGDSSWFRDALLACLYEDEGNKEDLDHPDIRALGLDLLAVSDRLGLALRLLRRSFRSEDWGLIEERLTGPIIDDDEVHGIGLGVINLLGPPAAVTREQETILLRLYETSPCSICRESAVARLVVAGCVPDWMAEECLFDAEPDTAKHFER